jgi:hypothetical protein
MDGVLDWRVSCLIGVSRDKLQAHGTLERICLNEIVQRVPLPHMVIWHGQAELNYVPSFWFRRRR